MNDATITAVRASAYEVPCEQPESDGTLRWDSTVLVIAEVDAGGTTGLGYTYGHQAAVPLITGKLAAAVSGRAPLDVRAISSSMVDVVRNLGCTGLASIAISAVDIALWDLKARLLDVPLVVALDAAHDAVPIYGSGGFTSYSDKELEHQLRGWVDAGIPRVKMKTGREPSRDRDRVKAARAAIGDDVELFVDANGAYTVRDAIAWAHIYHDEFAVRWYEEPVSSDDLEGMALVRASAPGGIDIAAGEYSWTPWQSAALVGAGAVDCVQIDVTRCLGITGFLAAAGAADGHQLDVSAHCAPQISAHASTAVRRLRHLEYFHDHVRIESMLFEGVLQPEPGGLLRPDRGRPGHGLTFKQPDAERFRVA